MCQGRSRWRIGGGEEWHFCIFFYKSFYHVILICSTYFFDIYDKRGYCCKLWVFFFFSGRTSTWTRPATTSTPWTGSAAGPASTTTATLPRARAPSPSWPSAEVPFPGSCLTTTCPAWYPGWWRAAPLLAAFLAVAAVSVRCTTAPPAPCTSATLPFTYPPARTRLTSNRGWRKRYVFFFFLFFSKGRSHNLYCADIRTEYDENIVKYSQMLSERKGKYFRA